MKAASFKSFTLLSVLMFVVAQSSFAAGNLLAGTWIDESHNKMVVIDKSNTISEYSFTDRRLHYGFGPTINLTKTRLGKTEVPNFYRGYGELQWICSSLVWFGTPHYRYENAASSIRVEVEVDGNDAYVTLFAPASFYQCMANDLYQAAVQYKLKRSPKPKLNTKQPLPR